MVKGVNKTIIEINNTGSKYFDRVLLFVNPSYASVPKSRLESKAAEIISAADPGALPMPKKRKKARLGINPLWSLLFTAAAVVITLLLK